MQPRVLSILHRTAIFEVVLLCAAFVLTADAQLMQQGHKLIGTGAAGAALKGWSVSVSSDGNTAIVGGYLDNSSAGAAWIFTRTRGAWRQQGNKLIGSGAVGGAMKGFSVSISSDGNTAIVGGYHDNGLVGAAWIFTRSDTVWTQQGPKLIGTGALGFAWQGYSVAISSDGNTAIIGGIGDSPDGAAWVFTRNAGVWTQQGPKLVGTGGVDHGQQGWSVSLSSDGNTAIIGGVSDSAGVGAAWVFTRSAGIWTQQGEKLVGTGAVNQTRQGFSSSLSSDGNTAIIGGPLDDDNVGAAWVFTRSAGVWTQQGEKLIGTGATGPANQGTSVDLSSDGNTAIVGGFHDTFVPGLGFVGAAWIFERSGSIWTQAGDKLVGTGATNTASQGSGVALSSDATTAIVGGKEDNNSAGAVWVYTKLVVTRPEAGKGWVAGNQDTIRWTGGTAGNFLNIDFTTDEANGSYESIVQNYPSDSGSYVWNIPDTILSRKCRITIEDTSDPDSRAFSEIFRIKGYVLTRVKADSNYELFRLLHNNWGFENGEGMWEQSWWQQFDYANGDDPYTHQRYDSDFTSWIINAKPENFPDWPLFVRVYGVQSCYRDTEPDRARMLQWAVLKSTYGGSCYGFAISSLLAFEKKHAWINRFEVPDFSELFLISPNDTVKRAINEVWAYNLAGDFISHNYSGLAKTANETLTELKDAFLNHEGNSKCIVFQEIVVTPSPGIICHAVTPYKITKDSTDPNVEYIHIYDNNEPLEDSRRITVNTSANTWEYSPNAWGYDIGGTHGIWLSRPTTAHLASPGRPAGIQKNISSSAGTDYFQLYTNPLGSTRITDQFGGSMIYEADDSTVVNTIVGAVPLIPATGFHHPPIGYLLPPGGTYRALVHGNMDSVTYLATFTDSLILFAGHSSANPSHQDWFTYDAGTIGVGNPDAVSKALNFGGVIVEDTAGEKSFDLLGLITPQNDSLRVEVRQHDLMKLTNVGSPKSYDLRLRNASGLGVIRFDHPAVPVDAMTSHFIEPVWNSLGSVRILVDLGNNGTIDDTMIVGNTLGVDEGGATGLPKEYSLAQNYPNPFNPVTTIQYALPSAGLVSLKIFDILGRELRTLVNEAQDAGFKSIRFDATGLSSGVYFYRLASGSFSATRKLLLVK